jgi:hypothetical protein
LLKSAANIGKTNKIFRKRPQIAMMHFYDIIRKRKISFEKKTNIMV